MEFSAGDPIVFNISLAPPATVVLSAVPQAAPVALMPVPGAPGATGQPGTNARVTGEVPAGVIDGINDTYTTAHTFVADSTAIVVNGLRQVAPWDYAELTDGSILFAAPPTPGDQIIMDYLVRIA